MNRHFTRSLAAAAAALALGVTALAAPSAAAPVGGRLYAAAATSGTDIWAVGIYASGSLIRHYNGRGWTQTEIPLGVLAGVAASSPGNAWAVGGTNWFTPSTMTWHWDGADWIRVKSPSPAPNSRLAAAATTSDDNAWAVGYTGTGSGTIAGPAAPTRPARTRPTVGQAGDLPLIEHWNGTAWSIVPGPASVPSGELRSVVALSPIDAWAVGWTGATLGPGSKPLIEHWDGATWTQVPSPNPVGTQDSLNAVSFDSPSDGWATGTYQNAAGLSVGLTQHWNGTSWTAVTSPAISGGADFLAVGATSPTNAWATGLTRPQTCEPQCASLIEHWNGATWTRQTAPDPLHAYLNVYLGIAAIAGGNAWAVGTEANSETLIAHWNGTTWK
jgi:hypothetical protein